MKAEADVVYQGVLLARQGDGPALYRRPDFLVRGGLLPAPGGEARPGGPHYEVVDAKLARSAKARAVAQAGFYPDLLAGLQGVRPRWIHLALGGGEFATLKVSDYAAFERQAGGGSPRSSRTTAGHSPTPSRLSTARSAGGGRVARTAGGATTTCRWSPGGPRGSGAG